SINEKNRFIEEARNMVALINRYATELNQKIALSNSNACSVNQSPLVDESIFKDPINENIKNCKDEMVILEDNNKEIALQFQKQGISQDI
ncbi:DNA repair protein, partial [Vibrio cholerae]|nr:DNA repair protein [Vibrio cholerae]